MYGISRIMAVIFHLQFFLKDDYYEDHPCEVLLFYVLVILGVFQTR